MRKLTMALAIAIGVLGSTAMRADAQTIGPYCFSVLPFSDQFSMFFTPTGAGQFTGSGKNLTSNNAPMSTQLVLSGSTAIISFIAPLPPTGGAHTFMGTASVSTASGSGPGRCETVNTTGGCGLGSSFTLTIISCPPGALTTDPPVATDTARGSRSMDGTDSRR